MADLFGVSRAAISQYQIGTGEVNAGDLPRLADILGVSLLESYKGPLFYLRNTSSENRNWPVKSATFLLEKSGVLNRSHQGTSRQDIGKNKLEVSADSDRITRDHIFIVDEWLGAGYGIPDAGEHERDLDSKACRSSGTFSLPPGSGNAVACGRGLA